ncbi:hypothetical protein C9374_010037 [Naegleria lovaniensis]|uniref:F-box domain-containing protein n=1 Tax=Naegleria lovaniensis TaxID=51637 RepID=A0AA88KEI2_NAELO|nr:uncharacterized protein C9374_010037 [Naegleria lovaniensis]KAG2375033.1 hypothetical protein C9374_010037 [Naegleria lovaniensis]
MKRNKTIDSHNSEKTSKKHKTMEEETISSEASSSSVQEKQDVWTEEVIITPENIVDLVECSFRKRSMNSKSLEKSSLSIHEYISQLMDVLSKNFYRTSLADLPVEIVYQITTFLDEITLLKGRFHRICSHWFWILYYDFGNLFWSRICRYLSKGKITVRENGKSVWKPKQLRKYCLAKLRAQLLAEKCGPLRYLYAILDYDDSSSSDYDYDVVNELKIKEWKNGNNDSIFDTMFVIDYDFENCKNYHAFCSCEPLQYQVICFENVVTVHFCEYTPFYFVLVYDLSYRYEEDCDDDFRGFIHVARGFHEYDNDDVKPLADVENGSLQFATSKYLMLMEWLQIPNRYSHKKQRKFIEKLLRRSIPKSLLGHVLKHYGVFYDGGPKAEDIQEESDSDDEEDDEEDDDHDAKEVEVIEID